MVHLSSIVGVSGAKEQDAAGLFVFSPDRDIPYEYEDTGLSSFETSGAIAQGVGFNFYNKVQEHSSSLMDFVTGIGPQNVFWTAHVVKNGPRAFFNVFAGSICRPIKVISRDDTRASTTVFIYPGIPPEKGGKTWVITPHLLSWFKANGISAVKDLVLSSVSRSCFTDCFAFDPSVFVKPLPSLDSIIHPGPFLCVTDAVIGVVRPKTTDPVPGMIVGFEGDPRTQRGTHTFNSSFYDVYKELDNLRLTDPSTFKVLCKGKDKLNVWQAFLASTRPTGAPISSSSAQSAPQAAVPVVEEEIEAPMYTLDVDAMF